MTVHQAGNPVARHPVALGAQGGMHTGERWRFSKTGVDGSRA